MLSVVKSLYCYPVKSCKGVELTHAQVDERGIRHDRSWLIVSESGMAVTQRDFPRMSLIETEIVDERRLRLYIPEKGELLLDATDDGLARTVRVWDDTCDAVDQGEQSSVWLSEFLGTRVHLVRMREQFVRPVTSKYATSSEQQVGFADGFPFLLLAEASLEDLNQKLEFPVLMNRFRPNIVVSGCAAFAEDSWKSIQIGDLQFDVVKPCARCLIISIDQEDANISKEPMRTLSFYRQFGKKVLFGQNLVHHSAGSIQVGDEVRVLK